jgi:uncharacterized protein YecE (DUF72 family)
VGTDTSATAAAVITAPEGHGDAPHRREVRVGICSWADAALIEDGSFYPKKSMSSADRLRFYAAAFDTVEVNASYYAIPAPRNALLWTERTPPGFVFNIKAYSLLTGHHPRAESLPAELRVLLPADPKLTRRGDIDRSAFGREALGECFRLYREALTPLADAGKLGYVLFQFAPWIRFSEKGLAYLASLPAELPGWTLAVEFRDPSWFPDHAEETLAVMQKAGLAHVVVDAPGTPNAIPKVVAVTAPTAVLRLHGRNPEGWLRQLRGQDPSVREKYDYLYTEGELGEMLPEVAELEEGAERVFISFNNNNRAYPVQNARMMLRLLGQRPYGRVGDA